MADMSKRGASDCEDGEGGERGKRGKRGERGERGERGHTGLTGPGGPATSLIGPTSGPGAQEASEDIPAGFVVAITGSVSRAGVWDGGQGFAACPVICLYGCELICLSTPLDDGEDQCYYVCKQASNTLGVTSAPVSAGAVAQYVAAGPLTLDAAIWDASTGESGGLIPSQSYYLSQTEPGRLTALVPLSGIATKIGTAINPTTLNVQIASAQTDGITLIPRPPVLGAFSAAAYGFAGGLDLRGRHNASWELAAATLPGTPIYKNLLEGTDLIGQQPASAAAWLSSHVLGLTPIPPTAPTDMRNPFISGGLFELTKAQWNAVWTATDPNRGLGSGLLPGYPYYLSDVPGTFFLIDKTGNPPVASGNWLTKCFVALSPTTALIQISDPRKISTVAAALHTEDTSTTPLALTNNSDTEVLSCPSIVPGTGNFVQVTGDVAIQLLGNTSNTEVLAIVTLKEDGAEIARFSASLAPNTGDGDFNFFGSLPVAWTFVAAVGPHIYSINVITDASSDGAWTAQNRAMFVDVLPP